MTNKELVNIYDHIRKLHESLINTQRLVLELQDENHKIKKQLEKINHGESEL